MKFIFIDIDGTLYDHKNQFVAKSSLEAIKKLREKNNRVFLCTGRSLSESLNFLEIGVDGFIFCSGSQIYVENKKIYEIAMEVGEIRRLTQIFEENDIGYCLEGSMGSYYNARALDFLKYYFKMESLREEDFYKHGFFPLTYYDERDPVCKICLYTYDSKNFEVLNTCAKSYTWVDSSPEDSGNGHYLEITHKNINKSTAIKRVLDIYGKDYDDAIGIGDSDNDYEMLRDCGIGIAMGNAAIKEKEVADFITSSVSDDGIYKAFKKLNMI